MTRQEPPLRFGFGGKGRKVHKLSNYYGTDGSEVQIGISCDMGSVSSVWIMPTIPFEMACGMCFSRGDAVLEAPLPVEPKPKAPPIENPRLFPDQELTFEEIEKAFWLWVNTHCKSQSSRTRGRWMHENSFLYDGTIWKRHRDAMSSNSGKTELTTNIVYKSEDGRVLDRATPRALNRRNDPDRNWGLGRD